MLCSCVQNAEVASTLRDFIIDALKKPDKTFECVEEVLMTTFCNPMDGASLASLCEASAMPLRAFREPSGSLPGAFREPSGSLPGPS